MFRLCVPFLYFFETRIRSCRERIAWLFTYIVPLCLMAAAANPLDPFAAAATAAIAAVGVYAAYEFGYMVNDSVTIHSEKSPTLRLPPERLDQVRRSLPWVLVVRMLLVAAATWVVHVLVRLNGGNANCSASMVAALCVGIVLWYAVYNRVRSHASIALFLVLVSARCIGPVAVTLSAAGAISPGILLLLAVYTLPQTMEFAAKPKYKLGWLLPVHTCVDVWRVAYYAAACAVTAVVVLSHASQGSASIRALVVGLLYFLIYRTLIVLSSLRIKVHS